MDRIKLNFYERERPTDRERDKDMHRHMLTEAKGK